jgi:hypothetical protein
MTAGEAAGKSNWQGIVIIPLPCAAETAQATLPVAAKSSENLDIIPLSS